MVVAYLDDILVAGKTEQEHLINLAQVLKCLDSAGMKLEREKCAFCLPQVEYLEHVISEQGLCPAVGQVKAIKQAFNPHHCLSLSHFLAL